MSFPERRVARSVREWPAGRGRLGRAVVALGLLAGLLPAGLETAALGQPAHPAPALRNDDRVLVVGSSSTRIGVWPRTLEFLLRTRHPGLVDRFERTSTGGGTFATALENLDAWLDQARPTVVLFNFGANDASEGFAGLGHLERRMTECVAKTAARGARSIFVTPQAADPRKAGLKAASRRALYAETMLAFGRRQGWIVVDVHHPLEQLQRVGQQRDRPFSILKDSIHLTDPAYVAMGFFLYDRLDLPLAVSRASLTAAGEVVSTEHCQVRDVEHGPGTLAFTRTDLVLPILPPVTLPPRAAVPLEAHSRYMLQVSGLEEGEYEVLCEKQRFGHASAAALEAGLNLNALLLDQNGSPPWQELAERLWKGEFLQRIGNTPWRFELRKRVGDHGAKEGAPVSR